LTRASTSYFAGGSKHVDGRNTWREDALRAFARP
jgi:hypothetical protein